MGDMGDMGNMGNMMRAERRGNWEQNAVLYSWVPRKVGGGRRLRKTARMGREVKRAGEEQCQEEAVGMDEGM